MQARKIECKIVDIKEVDMAILECKNIKKIYKNEQKKFIDNKY